MTDKIRDRAYSKTICVEQNDYSKLLSILKNISRKKPVKYAFDISNYVVINIKLKKHELMLIQLSIKTYNIEWKADVGYRVIK